MEKYPMEGTKAEIFDAAVEMFAFEGMGNVSMRDIASRVGIKPSSIYNHFPSKEDIIQSVYDYHRSNHNNTRKSLEEMDPVFRRGTSEEIFNILMIEYNDMDDPVVKRRMKLITKIIYSTMFIDQRAGEIYWDVMNQSSIVHLERAFRYGIEIGRFRPFDTLALAHYLVGMYVYMGINMMLKLEFNESRLWNASDIEEQFARLLPLNPPIQ